MNKITISLLLLLSVWNMSFCCTCIGKKSTKEAFRKNDVILVGQVISIRKKSIPYFLSGTQKRVTTLYYHVIVFETTKILKGKNTQIEVEIFTGIGNGDCGFPFKLNQRYVVYADWKDQHFNGTEKVPKFLYTDLCERTTDNVKNEINEINRMRKYRCSFIRLLFISRWAGFHAFEMVFTLRVIQPGARPILNGSKPNTS